ncbi:MAG: hypothetical protein K8I00_00425 [Candidatus Omnitrophica bacterium]|nr:hypothetical protein [Candidatus Omnitrophota bacterium]
MKIPKYWAKEKFQTTDSSGKPLEFFCYRGSMQSVEEARRLAAEAVRTIAQNFVAGKKPARYAYADRPLREEIIQEITEAEDTVALVTRNSYGALVLNTARVMFVDIDCPFNTFGERIKHFFARLFKQPYQTPKEKVLARIEEWARNHPRYEFRIYETFAGYRCLMTNQTFDPRSDEAKDILESMGSDPLYRKLCEVQECFRARLTPKPFRCECPNPDTRFPYDTPEAEQRHHKWVQEYDAKIKDYATCRLVKVIGSHHVDGVVGEVVELHDKTAVVDKECRLA